MSADFYSCPVPEPDETSVELAAAIAARRELGPDYEDAVVASFLARIDDAIKTRVDAQVAERMGAQNRTAEPSGRGAALGIWSLVLAIPTSAIASGAAGLSGLVVTWAGIAIVNVAWAARRRG